MNATKLPFVEWVSQVESLARAALVKGIVFDGAYWWLPPKTAVIYVSRTIEADRHKVNGGDVTAWTRVTVDYAEYHRGDADDGRKLVESCMKAAQETLLGIGHVNNVEPDLITQ